MYPDPIPIIKFSNGGGIYLYGICMAVGIIACFAFLLITMRFKKFNEGSNDAIIFIGVFGTGLGILSAMLFQSIYNAIAGKGFNFGESMTFIGGLIGGAGSFLIVWNLYMYVIRPRTKIKWLKPEMNATLSDALPFIPIAITIAHAFGRFGCFWGGCCYGMPTDAWYGLKCADGWSNYLNMNVSNVSVVPIQLFEMFFLIALGVIMAILYFKFKFNYNFAVYPIAYGIWRFIIEFFRGDDRGELFPGSVLSPSQIWSIVMVVVGIGYIFLQMFVLSKLMKHPELTSQSEEPQEKNNKDDGNNQEQVTADN